MTEGEDLEQLARRVVELERELTRLVAEREVREVEIAALRADLALKADYLATLERIPDEVVAPKDVHIRNLEAIITQLNEALAARSQSRPLWRRAVGRFLRRVRPTTG